MEEYTARINELTAEVFFLLLLADSLRKLIFMRALQRASLNDILMDSDVAGILVAMSGTGGNVDTSVYGDGSAEAQAKRSIDMHYEAVLKDLKDRIDRESKRLDDMEDEGPMKKVRTDCTAEELMSIRFERRFLLLKFTFQCSHYTASGKKEIAFMRGRRDCERSKL